MNYKKYLNKIFNSLKIKKNYCIFKYNRSIYSLLLLLKNYCVKSLFIINNWILVIFNYNNKFNKTFNLKVFNVKNKENYYTYTNLKKLVKYNKHGIILTNKGICSLNHAIKSKQGGILLVLFYTL